MHIDHWVEMNPEVERMAAIGVMASPDAMRGTARHLTPVAAETKCRLAGEQGLALYLTASLKGREVATDLRVSANIGTRPPKAPAIREWDRQSRRHHLYNTICHKTYVIDIIVQSCLAAGSLVF